MAYGQKIIDRIGVDAWERYKADVKAAMARAEGVPVEKTTFDWSKAYEDGPRDGTIPECHWEDHPAGLKVVTQWKGHFWQDVMPLVNTDTGFVDPATGKQVQPPIDTGFQPAPTPATVQPEPAPVETKTGEPSPDQQSGEDLLK